MSNTMSTLPATNNELVELQPEMETLSAAQARGGLLPAVQPSPLVPAVQMTTGGYLQPGTLAGAFDAFRN